MKNLIIAGAGNAAREILQISKDINKNKKLWNIEGFIADSGLNINHLTNGDFDIIGTINDWKPKKNEVYVCAIADPKSREIVVNKLTSRGAEFVNLIHPTAMINDYCKLGKGLVLYPYCSIGSNTKIGNYVIIQKTDIAHDVSIDNFTTVSSLCGILGRVNLGKRVFVGCNSIIIPGKKIGDNAYIGTGSVVINNVKANSKVFGNPARTFDL